MPAFTLIYIRYRQAIREVRGLGVYGFFLLGLAVFAVYNAYNFFQHPVYAYLVSAVVVAIGFSFQTYRQDRDFVYRHIDNPHPEVYTEYALITLPLSLVSLFTAHWYCFFLIQAGLYAVTFYRPAYGVRTYFRHISRFIPAAQFELISGFRRSFAFIIPVYILALALSWFRFLPLFLLWLITMSVLSFYNECEPENILAQGGKSSWQHLKRKLITHSAYLLLLYTPVYVVNTIFNWEYWWATLLFIPMQVVMLWLAISLKYAFYRPNRILYGNNVTLSIVAIGSLIPFLLPIPMVMAAYYIPKANNNLKFYLHD